MDDEQVTAVAALADPTRRRIYELLVERGEPVGRDQVATALRIGRTLAVFHLDKLAEAGLADFGFARGPSGGRPAKLYRRSAAQVAVTLPPRSYVDAAGLLAEAVERAGADLVLQEVAERHGRSASGGDMWKVLREHGYEPHRDDDMIRLRNCPFHVLAEEFPPLVCGMNLALLTGLATGGQWPVQAKLRPEPGRCCVILECE